MEETVECAECGNRYDSASQPFCPRCGSESGRTATAASYAPVRMDARGRRARAGGVILLILGSLALLQSGWTLVAPPAPDAEQLELLADVGFLQDQPGGTARLAVVQNGTPVDAAVTVLRMDGRPVENATTAAGTLNLTDLPSAFVNLTMRWEGQTWFRHVYVPASETLDVTVDVAADAPGTVEWEAVEQLTATRVLAAFLVLFSAFVVLGGVLALRLQKWGIALAAAILVALPALLLTAIVPLAGLLLLLPGGLALAFVAMGRPYFR